MKPSVSLLDSLSPDSLWQEFRQARRGSGGRAVEEGGFKI